MTCFEVLSGFQANSWRVARNANKTRSYASSTLRVYHAHSPLVLSFIQVVQSHEPRYLSFFITLCACNMASLITSREPGYHPVFEEKEDTEACRLSTETDDEALTHGRRIYSSESRRLWPKLRYLLSLAVCLTLYSWIVVTITNKLSSRLSTPYFAGSTNVYPDC